MNPIWGLSRVAFGESAAMDISCQQAFTAKRHRLTHGDGEHGELPNCRTRPAESGLPLPTQLSETSRTQWGRNSYPVCRRCRRRDCTSYHGVPARSIGMGNRFPAKEEVMKCHVCSSGREATTSDLPFKLAPNRIVIFKNLPVLQCQPCGACLLQDTVMAHVEGIRQGVDVSAELDIVRYAA